MVHHKALKLKGGRGMSKNKTAIQVLLGAVGLFLLTSSIGWAQVTTGSFRGRVTDPSGAIVVGAKITFLLKDRGFSRNTITGIDGSYELPSLLPGTYSVTVEKAGFKKYTDTSLVLYPLDLRRVDVQLEVGEVTEVIEVTAQGAVVNTEQTALSVTIPQRWIDFKAGGRGSSGPEFEFYTAGGTGHFSFHSGGFQWANHGSEGNETRGSMDGIEQTNLGNFRTNQYMIKDVKLNLVNSPAEFQVTGTMQSVSRSGTNDIHGTVLAQINNTALDALGAPTTRGPGLPSHNIEFAVGGPLVIPKVYDGRNKTFWHFTGFRVGGSSSGASTFLFPYAAMRTGDLSIYKEQIRDLDGTPFPGNIIPSNRIHPVSAAIMQKYIPLPNNPGLTTLTTNYTKLNSSNNSEKNYQFRVDQKIGNPNTLSVVYYRLGRVSKGEFDFSPVDGGTSSQPGATGLSIQDTHVFGTHTVNEVILTRSNVYNKGQNGNQSGKAYSDSIGLTSTVLGGRALPDSLGAPRVIIAPFGPSNNTGQILGRLQGINVSNNIGWALKDNLSHQWGKHLLKGGVAWGLRIPEYTSVGGDAWGNYNFNGFATGNTFADFLLGVPTSSSITGTRGLSSLKGNEIGVYFQDEYKVTSRLTLSLGVRYQTFTPMIDTTGKFYNFDFDKMRMVVPDGSLAFVHPAFPKAIPIVTASAAGYPSNLVPEPSFGGWEPRIGIAWRPWGNKTVFRTGYGLFHVPMFDYTLGGTLGYGPNTGGPFQLSESFPTNVITNGVPALSFSNPFPTARAGATGAQGVTALPKGLKMGYTQQWNATVERDLGGGFGLRTSYVGSKTTQMPYNQNMQTVYPPSTTPFSLARLPIQPTSVWASVGVRRNGGNMTFHGFEAELHRKFAAGLYFLSVFNWNKTLRDVYYATQSDYAFDRSRDKGQDNQTEPLNGVTSLVYPLPLGRGQKYWNFSGGLGNSILENIAGGWTISNSFSWSAGKTWAATYSGFDSTGTGISGGRPDLICDNPNRSNVSPSRQTKDGYSWDPGCFRIPSVDGTKNPTTSSGATNRLGRFGNAPYGILNGPGGYGTSISLFKNFLLAPAWGDKSPRFQFTTLIGNIINHDERVSGARRQCETDISSPAFGFCRFTGTARSISFVTQLFF